VASPDCDVPMLPAAGSGYCALTGFVAGAPLTICGGILVKSGVKNLKKLNKDKSKKHKKHVCVDIED